MKEIDIKTTQKISLDILKKITDICEANNFRYFLIYGTLLGAIRHQGFIPWDDDVDIMMPREDHDKLLNYLKLNLDKNTHLEIFNHTENSMYPYMITRISDNRYEIDMDNEKKYGMGVFIDIYPYDGLGNTKKEAIKLGLKGDRLSSCCYQATRNKFKIETTTSNLSKFLKFPVFLLSKIIGKEYFQKRLEKLANIKKYDSSEFVGCVVWLSGGERDIFPREWFDDYLKVPYEEYSFRIPKQYDKVLSHIYGDYMKLPPLEERVGHHNYRTYEK